MISDSIENVRGKLLGGLVGAFKTVSTQRINATRGLPGQVVWQRNYYEHIVRNDSELFRIRQYIAENPVRWDLDRENPNAAPPLPVEPWEV
jgi:putative transposase